MQQQSEATIQIFFQTLKLIGAEEIDFEGLAKQYRVPVNVQMFQKSNPKGMALLLYPLLCYFDRERYGKLYESEQSWFPYALAEMKSFKQISLFICNDLAEKNIFSGELNQETGQIENTILTK